MRKDGLEKNNTHVTARETEENINKPTSLYEWMTGLGQRWMDGQTLLRRKEEKL